MSENKDTLHLWFKPVGGVLNDADLSFVERYARRLYPKAMTDLAKNLHRLVSRVTQMCPPDTFEYQMTHMTMKTTSRYLIQESLRDITNPDGLSFGIQATTPDERQMFAQCFKEESFGQSVASVVAYLEDCLQSDPQWENLKTHSGRDALPVLKEIIEFLKGIKNLVRVHTFEINYTQRGRVLTLAMLSPGVLSYYTRIDWVIV